MGWGERILLNGGRKRGIIRGKMMFEGRMEVGKVDIPGKEREEKKNVLQREKIKMRRKREGKMIQWEKKKREARKERRNSRDE